MANQIENIYAKQAEDQLKKILDGLTSIHKKQMELNNNAIDFYGGRTASSVADMKKVEVSMQRLQAQAERNRIAELKLATQREKAFDKYEANLVKLQAKEQASQNLYNKTQQQLNKVQAAYNNLAAKKERYNNLSVYEEGRLKTLQVITEKYNTTLKAVDATVGKHTRNVGNYAGAFNPLSNSINQLTREMPAFAFSAQTGFMAISNNLPIFFDAMQQAIAQQKELQAQGLPTKNALQLLAGSFLTLGTALSVGVTLLTVFGPKLWDSISGSKAKKEALEAEKKALEDKNNTEKQAYQQQIQYASSEISRSKILLETAKNVSLSYSQRVKAVNELQSRYPSYLGNLSKEEILAGKTANAEYRLNDALMKRAMFLAIKDKIAETTKALVDAEFDYIQLEKQATDANKVYDEQMQKTTKTKQKFRLATDQDMNSMEGLRSSVDKHNETLKKEGVVQESSTIVYQKKTLAVREQLETLFEILNKYAKYNDVVVEDTKNTKANKEAKEDLFKAETNSRASFEKNIQALEEQLQVTSKLNPVYGALEFQLRLLKDAYEALYGEQKKQESVQDPKFGTLEYYENLKSKIQEQQKTIATTNPEWEHYQRLLEAVQIDIDILTGKQEKLNETFFDSKKYFQGFVDSFAGQSGFSEIFNVIDLLGKKFETVEEKALVVGLAISEAFQQAFNTISQMSDANYQRMYDNLERQRDTSILFAGESTTAREEVERQYEERRKRIQRQQAEAQKRLAMFNIAINTAQGITSALAMLPPNIPLAVTIGVIGAAQLAMTASQPIPQFAIGTQNAPEGMAWTDERGAELHTDKNGKIKDLGSDKGARLKKLSKGDKIYTASQTKKILDLYSFNKEYDNIMLTNGIAPAPQVGQTINLEPLNARLDKLTSVVANKSEVTIMNNESGTRYYERVNGQRRELVNSVLTMKSRSVR